MNTTLLNAIIIFGMIGYFVYWGLNNAYPK
jgi:hypothetical protein